jgi:hypothetical protein
MRKKKSPEIMDLPVETLEGLKSRLASSSLLEEDKSILLAILTAYVWIQRQLQSTKLTIHRLKKMFGFSTEKKNKMSKKREPAELELDLKSLEALNKGSLNALQAMPEEPPTKK